MEGFQDIVTAAWKTNVRGSAFYVWEEKLRIVKKALKDWVKLHKSPKKQRMEAEKALEDHHFRNEGSMDQSSLNTEISLHNKIHEACRLEEKYWKIKSRIPWLREGDKNTKFFHKQAEVRNHFKNVSKIDHLGNQLTAFEEIKKAAHDHFQEIYTENYPGMDFSHSDILDNIPNLVSDHCNRMLLRPVTLEEVKCAIDSMIPDKASGPDGFTANFFHYFWDMIKGEVWAIVEESRTSRGVLKSFNATFLALIPKSEGADAPSVFRPIALCNVIYKLISKVIANRLKPLPLGIINPKQLGFVEGRQILDGIITV